MVDTPKTMSINETQPQAAAPVNTPPPAHTPQANEPSQTVNQPVSDAPAPDKSMKIDQPDTSFMTVKQKYEYLKVKNNRGILNDKEKEEYKKLEDQINGPEGTITPKDGKKIGDEDKKDTKFFEEEDVIKYMYTKWLLAGADWLFNRAFNSLEKGVEKFENAVLQGRANRNARKNSKDETVKFNDTLNDKLIKDEKARRGKIDEGAAKVIDFLNRIREGKIPPEEMTEADRFFTDKKKNKEAIRRIETAARNIKAIRSYAAMLSQAQLTSEMCTDSKAFDGKNPYHIHEAMANRNAILIARRMNEIQEAGGDPSKFLEGLQKSVDKAIKHNNKMIGNGRYEERTGAKRRPDWMLKTYKPNPHLAAANELLGITPENQGNTIDEQPHSLLESLMATNDYSQMLKEDLQENNNNTGALAARKENNDSRRAHLEQVKANYYKNLAARGSSIANDVKGVQQAQQQSAALKNPKFNPAALHYAGGR